MAEDVAEAMKAIGIFEWSATPGCDKWDRDEWAQANPSMGYGFLDESTGTCFVSDCFGAPLSSVELATADEVGAVSDDELARSSES